MIRPLPTTVMASPMRCAGPARSTSPNSAIRCGATASPMPATAKVAPSSPDTASSGSVSSACTPMVRRRRTARSADPGRAIVTKPAIELVTAMAAHTSPAVPGSPSDSASALTPVLAPLHAAPCNTAIAHSSASCGDHSRTSARASASGAPRGPGAVGWTANRVPKSRISPAASTSAEAGCTVTARIPASAGPTTNPTSSRVVSKDRAVPIRALSSPARCAQRARASGPTWGTVSPAATAKASRAGSDSPPRTAATRAARTAAFATQATSSTGRWPRRSASRPMTGPPRAWPSQRAAATVPASPIPSRSLMSRSVPMGHGAAGSRARNA